MLSIFYNASDAFVTSSKSLRSGLTRAELARLATIPEENVGGIMRFKVQNGTGLASPINRNIPGFIGHGKTIGGLDEFVIPNQPINNFNFSLELPH